MKTNRIFTLSILAVTVLMGCTMTSCIKVMKSVPKEDFGKELTKEINLPDTFSTIETLSVTDIEYTQGPLKATLTAPEKIIDKINITVEKGTLKIEMDQEVFNRIPNSRLTISAPSVNNFITSGTGDISIKNTDTKELSLASNGTGDIRLTGAKCTKFDAVSNGTGDIEISHLSCVVGSFNTYGTGDINVKRLVAEKISGQTTGTGDLTVSGECKEARLTSTGVGDVNDRGLEITKSEEE